MAQKVKGLAVLLVDMGSILSTYMAAENCLQLQIQRIRSSC